MFLYEKSINELKAKSSGFLCTKDRFQFELIDNCRHGFKTFTANYCRHPHNQQLGRKENKLKFINKSYPAETS